MSGNSATSAPDLTYARPLLRRDFQIAIICALPLEYDAAVLLIDEFWDRDGKQYGRTAGDPNTYRNGRIGIHNVVLMLLANPGKVASARSAGSLCTSYPAIRVAFLVGVCGGVPGVREMVLGDVIVSDDLVQYDFGKQYPSQFVSGDTVQVRMRAQSNDVLNILAYFRTEFGKNDLREDTAKYLKSLQDAAVSKGYACSYRYPGPTEDKLFAGNYRHKHREPSTCDLCCGVVEQFCDTAAGASCAELGCDESWLVARERLKSHSSQEQGRDKRPEVFFGRIASADRVMKSGEDRDRVAKQYNLIAFEMEGAGLWNEIPTIVVKGVCDYADSHKNKSWQPFAAATAAAVTKCILNRYNVSNYVDTIIDSSEASDTREDESAIPRSKELSDRQSSTIMTSTVQMSHLESLQDATYRFQKSLNSKNNETFEKLKIIPSATSVLIFTAQLDSHNRDRKGASIASRFHALLQSVRDFSSILESSSLHPADLPVRVWASMKLTILAGFSLASHYENLSKLFMSFGTLCPLLSEYNALYTSSVHLQGSLANFYASIIRCCTDVIRMVQRQWHDGFFSVFWDSFEHEFRPHTDEVRRYSKQVENAIWYAKSDIESPEKHRRNEEMSKITRNVHVMKRLFLDTGDKTGKQNNSELMIDERRAKERRQRLLDSLSTHDYLTPLKQGRRKRHSGTAEWLFDTREFQYWANSTESTCLWCWGKIGSGKTVLTASVVDKVLTEKRGINALVSFFFVRFDDSESLKRETILRSILWQVLSAEENSEREKAFLEKLEDASLVEPEQVIEILSTAIVSIKRLYIIIDGLDECQKQDRHSLLTALFSVTNVSSGIKIFLSGRESVSGEVQKMFPDCQNLSMGCGSVQSEISTYIDSAVQERLQCEDLIVGDEALIEEVKDALKRGADGMFLWVAFQIDALCSQHCDDDIRKAILDLPKDLTETFHRALRRIMARRNTDVASRCFRFVAAAKRPLSIQELREVLFIEIGQEFSKPERLPNRIHNISSWCENLVCIDEERRIVQFAHHTVLQFLTERSSKTQTSSFHFEIEEADHYLGEICVTYLGFSDFNTTVARRPSPRSNRRSQQAPQIMPTEIARSGLENEQKSRKLVHAVSRLAVSSRRQPSAAKVVGALISSETEAITTDIEESEHPFLKYASSHVLLHTKSFEYGKSATWDRWKEMVIYGNNVIKYPWGLDSLITNQLQALKWSLATHHQALVRLVYFRIEASNSADRNLVLSKAAAHGAINLVKTLLDAGASVNVPEGSTISPLELAASHGHLDVVKLLLDAGANVNVPVLAESPLHQAVSYGYLNIVNRLISAGAKLNVSSSLVLSPLHLAVSYGYLNIVNTLISAGARVNVSSGLDLSPLHLAVSHGYLNIVNTLISAGAKVNVPSRLVLSPLHLAAASGYLDIANALIDTGADVDAGYAQAKYSDRDLGSDSIRSQSITPLCKALSNCHPDIVDRLLAAGARFNLSEYGPQRALKMAAKCGVLDIVEAVLNETADMDLVFAEYDGWKALYEACENGHLEIVQRLLSAAVHLELDQLTGHSALKESASRGHVKIFEALKAAGVDANDPYTGQEIRLTPGIL